jgi:DinB superfamily
VTEVCSDCGFAWGAIPVASYGPALASLSSRYAERLTGDEARLRRRPAPEVWSPLEYACHVRDVLLAQRERVYLALVEDRPSFARMNREERVVLARYAEETPAAVRSDLSIAFRHMGIALTGRSPRDWARLLVYNFPGPAEHDLAWLGRHTIHECEHHLVDIDRGLS